MTSAKSISPQGAILRNPQFLKLFAGQIISALGDSVAYMGLSFLILYKLGGTALDVGKLMVAATIPTLAGPFIGVLVDRWSRRRVMIVADIVRGLIYLAMPLITSLPLIYIGVFCSSFMSRFFYPAKSAIVPNLVRQEELAVASGLNQTSGSVVSIIGPAVGGALAGWLGPAVTLYANAVSFFISGILIASIHVVEEKPVAASDAEAAGAGAAIRAFLRRFVEGVAFIVRNPSVRFYTTVFALFMLCIGGVNVLFVAFAKNVLGFDIRMLGIAESTQAVGGLLGGLVVTFIVSRFKPSRLIFGSATGVGLLLAALGVNRAPTLVLVLMSAIGFLMSALNIPFAGEMMRLIPNEVRGRVWAAFGSATDGCSLLSMAVMPAIAVSIGLPAIFVAMGLAVAALSLCALVLADRRLASPTPVAADAAAASE